MVTRKITTGRVIIETPVCTAIIEDINLVSPPSCFARIYDKGEPGNAAKSTATAVDRLSTLKRVQLSHIKAGRRINLRKQA